MKVLVTGGSGFIGSHLVDRLIENGDDVFVIDDGSGGKNYNENALYFGIDCRDFRKVDHVFMQIKPEVVYHLAANAAENKAQFSPVDSTSRNYDAFIKVLTAGIKHGMRRIVVTSSIAAYGDIPTPFKETDQCKPVDLYGLSKFAMEETLKIMSSIHDFEYVVARPHNVYGPRQSMTDPYRNVISLWINSLLQDKQYVIYGHGGQKRCYTYIDDVSSALLKCGTMDVDGEIFNIGADEAYTLLELSDALQKASGSTCTPMHLPDRPQEVKEAIEDHTKSKEVLGYKTSVTLEEGLKKTWEYAKKVGFKRPIYTDIELDSPKMPSNWRV